jgi:hypothetical protein
MDRSGREELLPEALFEFPEVGCLPSESGAMYLAEGGGPFAVAPPEKAVDGLIGVYAEELADDLHSEDLRVGELGRRAALANAAILESVVDETEDGDDEGAKIHGRKSSFTLVGLVATERREVFCLVQALKETCTRG